MRCLACNKILTEEEDAMIYDDSEERIQLCFDCLNKSSLYEQDYDDEY